MVGALGLVTSRRGNSGLAGLVERLDTRSTSGDGETRGASTYEGGEAEL